MRESNYRPHQPFGQVFRENSVLNGGLLELMEGKKFESKGWIVNLFPAS